MKADPAVGQNISVGVIGYTSPHEPAGPYHHVAVDANGADQTPAQKNLERVDQFNKQQTQQQGRA